ncbi:MBL fold metallo-hydrolase [Desmospora activa]|uniref:L-ascorbate metabolism protein UlaG (Beta-lactamase superfamily) n=1 Tax=Desmospora activa DSM 45169 TaxID=1121389 RepID=A0A2T4Z815_9BACL|nr:MBL fold metallo-hydrolase [Desmospora activa]PTM58042.1 L-ascorbate metabolism protein UlaG (beta-lactamase superfamily) [Desmospora activa DSM 45169]
MLWLIVAVVVACISWIIGSYRRKLPRPVWREVGQRPQVEGFQDDAITVTWLGHSTVYLNVKGVRILTDPVFSERVGIQIFRRWTLGPKRYTPPALDIKEIGEIDLILLSHAHMDHMDLPSLRALAGEKTQVITPVGTGRLLRSMPFRAVMEAGEGEPIKLDSGVMITPFPVRHWGNRYPWNVDYGFSGYMIEKENHRIAFSGDTAYTSFHQLRKWGPVDLILVPIGAYSPDSFQGSHCTPEQAWQMAQEAGAREVAPIHWNTFVLSQEPIEEPIQRLMQAAGPESDRIVIREQGAVWRLSETQEKPQVERKELQPQL